MIVHVIIDVLLFLNCIVPLVIIVLGCTINS